MEVQTPRSYSIPPHVARERSSLGGRIKALGRDHPTVRAASCQFAIDREVERILGLAEKFPQEITADHAVALVNAVSQIVVRPGGGHVEGP